MIIFQVGLREIKSQGHRKSQSGRMPVRPGELTVNVSRLIEVTHDQYSGSEAEAEAQDVLHGEGDLESRGIFTETKSQLDI